MKIRTGFCLATALLLVFCLPLNAQDGGGAAPVLAAPHRAPTTSPIDSTILPELSFENMPLEEVVNFLRDKVQGFNAAVVRDSSVPGDYPSITVKLREVTVGQFLEFLRSSYPGISIDRIEGPPGPLYVVRVNNPTGGPAGVPGLGAPMLFGPPLEMNQPMVSVYKLSDIVNELASKKSEPKNPSDRTKEALNDVLSLVQAALDQTEDHAQAVLKIHEPTQMLIFKGPPDKNAIVRQILETLKPNPQDQESKFRSQMQMMNMQTSQLRDKVENLQKQYDETRAASQDLRAQLEKVTVDNAVLKAQLEQASKELQQQKPKPGPQ